MNTENKNLRSEQPSFSLADCQGKLVRQADFRGVKNVLLVFNRTL